MSRRRPLAVAAVALAAVGGAAVALAATGAGGSPGHAARSGPTLHGDIVWRAGERPAPAFALHDQRGRPVSMASLHGQPLMLVFLDSKCHTFCPVVGRQLGEAERRLGGRPARLVTISVDTGDTAASVRSAARRWGWHGHWTWLMGSYAQLSPVWGAYDISVKPTAMDISHSLAVFLIDANGDERAGFLPPLAVPSLVRDVGLLQRGAVRGG